MKLGKIIIFVLIVAAFAVGVYYSQEVRNQISNLQKVDVGLMLTQVEKQLLTPPPLNIGGKEQQVTLLKSQIIAQTNFQRMLNESAPLQELKENTVLDAVAAAKAQDMFNKQYFEHVSPSGVGPGDLAQTFGYDYIVEGENLILGNFSSEKEVVDAWMASPGHRANILNTRFTEIGVAIIKGTYKGQSVWIGVQEFGLPLSVCTQPDANLRQQIDLGKTTLDVVFSEIDTLKNQIDNADRSSAVYEQMINNYNELVNQYNTMADNLKKIIAEYNSKVNIFNNCVAGK